MWDEAEVVVVYDSGCTNPDPSSATIDSNGDLLIICTEGFGAGPYNIKRIAGMGKAYQAQDAASFELAFTGLVPEGHRLPAVDGQLGVWRLWYRRPELLLELDSRCGRQLQPLD